MSKTMKCPKCKSTNIQVLGGGRKSLSAGKAIVGGALFNLPGLLVGGMMGKKGKYEVFCQDCGHRWKVK